MSFVCSCGGEDFYTHGDEEVVWYVNGDGDTYEAGDIVDSMNTHNWPYRCTNCEKEYSQIPPADAETEWVKAQERSYIGSKGSRCPICKSDDISGGSLEVDGSTVWQSVTCGGCEAEWTDIYHLRGVEVDSYSPDFMPEDIQPPEPSAVPNPNEAFKK